MKITAEMLTGQTDTHVTRVSEAVIHTEMVSSFERLRAKAALDGIDLQIASGFRDFSSQLRIWNTKAQGKRTLLDDKGNPLEYSKLSPRDLIFAILRWSALPGGSRHHWGTEIDVFDRAVLVGNFKDYKVALIPQEIAPGGVFERLNQWLQERMGEEGFFRPYEIDLGGVSPEWWHLSFSPVSVPYYEAFTLELLEEVLLKADLAVKEIVLKELPTIFTRYIRQIKLP